MQKWSILDKDTSSLTAHVRFRTFVIVQRCQWLRFFNPANSSVEGMSGKGISLLRFHRLIALMESILHKNF